MGGIFLLAGIPEGVELLFKLLVGNIDTHVLMTLACFSTLGIGAAMEVNPLLMPSLPPEVSAAVLKGHIFGTGLVFSMTGCPTTCIPKTLIPSCRSMLLIEGA